MKLTTTASILAISAATLVAAQDISILASSCAANDFLAATAASGNPCSTSDYLCQCTKGHDFLSDQLSKKLLANQGTCTASDIEGLPALAEKFCESVPGYQGSAAMSSVVAELPAQSSSIAAEVASVLGTGSSMASSAKATGTKGASMMASGTGTAAASGSSATHTGAASQMAVGGVVGMVGAAAMFVL
ncbi:hypothetical protein K490DRAFT_62177 [Saccharata proteae CBS 121410]|uniref:Extracellular membrane protein CFEM domain-containing protein n=1 Tax=Saccharata proteae CBS 121410 TaxID=1314787 RepID=A0A9P4M2G0_9PEZI|nr:hypothetical protein K490DRAFT_62177 [Saccharata proteae CBS 121410]